MGGVDVAVVLQDEQRVAAATAAAGIEIAAAPAIERLPCVLTNMTTEDLARVRFGDRSIVVKVARSPRHSPLWEQIPEPFRELTLHELPWRAEAAVYRSPLHEMLPPGLRLPAIYAVDELGHDRLAIWMEDVEERPECWSRDDYVCAARALGQVAGRLPQNGIAAAIPVIPRDLRRYFFGRVAQGTLPVLRDDATWRHPLIAASADAELRLDLERLAGRAPQILEALDHLPRTLAHGDACPQNLLRPVGEPSTVVAIDWTFAGICAVGMDAGQLLAGRAESGELDPELLPTLLSDIIEAYTDGVLAEGATTDRDDIRRGIIGNLVIRSAFTALPIEMLACPPEHDAETFFDRRVQYARFLVDLGLGLDLEA